MRVPWWGYLIIAIVLVALLSCADTPESYVDRGWIKFHQAGDTQRCHFETRLDRGRWVCQI